jgi:LuxR family transcriptional regulator
MYVSNAHEDLFHGLALCASDLGFRFCGYLVGAPAPGKSWQFATVNNYPPVWQELYRRQGYFAIDPTIQHARRSVDPLTWSPALYDQNDLADMSRQARDAGLNYGWTRSIRDSCGRFGTLTLARSEDAISSLELADKQPKMLWLAQVAHALLYHVLLARTQNESLLNQLTDREIEFLRLAADGKTAGEISKAMKVTERTANFHVGNAMEKLGAKNKTQAVALAMRLGLLD